MRNIFTTIELTNSKKCTILEIDTLVLLRANFNMLKYDEQYCVGLIAYILEQILLIEDKKLTLQNIFQLNIDDYLLIMNCINVQLTKINI